MVCLAMSAHRVPPQRVSDSLSWLAEIQRPGGGVPICESMTSPCWPTPLAVLAWSSLPEAGGAPFQQASKRAIRWLTKTEGRPIPHDPKLFGHDTTLIGWPWIDGTHSWIEPTVYAILALKASGYAEHRRVREGIRLIADRALTGGGWNYGNTRVLESSLRPFPATTGLALAALSDEPIDGRVERALAYLRMELEGVRSPISLCWGLIGLNAFDARPSEADTWLEQAASRRLESMPNALLDALLLLAATDWHPLAQLVPDKSEHRGF